jgi:hypothetical protein
MWNAKQWAGGALVMLALATVACGDDSRSGDVNGPTVARSVDDHGVVYDQVEFLGNPLVSEVTIVKANHDAYNRTQPYNTATFLPQTAQFVTGVAGRPPQLSAVLGSVLYPDILIVDSSKDPSTAGWLSWALASGWGGRKLTDDVVDVGLTAIFSTLLNPANASCAPFQLPLCTDNVGANDRPFSSSFPYLASPST